MRKKINTVSEVLTNINNPNFKVGDIITIVRQIYKRIKLGSHWIIENIDSNDGWCTLRQYDIHTKKVYTNTRPWGTDLLSDYRRGEIEIWSKRNKSDDDELRDMGDTLNKRG